ncbi:hypothetical protein BBJ28_00025552 [Nothophytophthora sp. Chile5]|nr:hypothetical protein BBJ28_00025552 [Nothophytophthora sp. Chile5]
MNIVTQTDLSADGAPLLRTGGGDDEEFLIASFAGVEIHAAESDLGAEDDADVRPLPQSGAAGQLFVTTRYYSYYMHRYVLEVFDALCKSAEMNPDDEDEDGDDGWICDEDEVADGARAAQLAAHLDSVLHVSPAFQNAQPEAGQFDDADEDEDDELL